MLDLRKVKKGIEKEITFLLRDSILFSAFYSSNGKESACSAGDLSSILWSERFLGEGNGSPLQYSCLENPMDRRAWWATVLGATKSQTQPSD